MKRLWLVIAATGTTSWAFAPSSRPQHHQHPHAHPQHPQTGPAGGIVALHAGPKRLDENIDGPLYVNEKCINCAACAMFAPAVFKRQEKDLSHVVHHQPATIEEIYDARAALSACPVAAIRVETNAHRNHRQLEPLTQEERELASQLAINLKFNGLEVPFPRLVSEVNFQDNVYFVGHHNEKSFGATPYLVLQFTQTQTNTKKNKNNNKEDWILVDSPKFSPSAVRAIESLTGPDGPAYLLLTHVDDSVGHNDWKAQYPKLKRIFHAGDLGTSNWLGDETLGDVEILLTEKSSPTQLQYFAMDGTPFQLLQGPSSSADVEEEQDDLVLIHTPGHSPGSLSLWKRPSLSSSDEDEDEDNDGSHVTPGVLFTGDTYGYTTRDGGRMTAFARYGDDRTRQSQTLTQLLELDWEVIAPGHGHVRDYTRTEQLATATKETKMVKTRVSDMEPAIQELQQWHY